MSDYEKDVSEKNILNKKTVFRVNPDAISSQLKLKSSEWQIYLQIDGKKTIMDAIAELDLAERELVHHIQNFHQSKLIIPNMAGEANNNASDIFVGTGFFDQIEKVLVHYIGPVASYVISDVLTELNEDKDKFPKENVPLLVESLSQEILDNTKRVKFQREMLEVIKQL